MCHRFIAVAVFALILSGSTAFTGMRLQFATRLRPGRIQLRQLLCSPGS